MGKHKKTDAPAKGAQVLFSELVSAERRGELFFVAKRSGNYTICSAHTAEYMRVAVRELSRLLAEYDSEKGVPPPTLEDIELGVGPAGVHWRAKCAGAWGPLTTSSWPVVAKVREFLNKLPPEGVTPIPVRVAAQSH